MSSTQFTRQVNLIVSAAGMLHRMLDDPAASARQLATAVTELRGNPVAGTHDGVETAPNVPGALDRRRVTDVSARLEILMDAIETAAARFALYETAGGDELGELVRLLVDQAKEVESAVGALGDSNRVVEHAYRVKRLESVADRVYERGLVRLLAEMTDPIEVLRRKDMLEDVERATDRAKDVADALEKLMVGHA